MQNEHWSARLEAALSAKDKPSYELLEESLQGLLEQYNNLNSVARDVSKALAEIVWARMQGDTDEALRRLDVVIATNVIVQVTKPETKH